MRIRATLPSASVAAQDQTAPRTNTYYIAADEIAWNYLPHGLSLSGLPTSDDKSPPRKMTYRKAVYRAYTDATSHVSPAMSVLVLKKYLNGRTADNGSTQTLSNRELEVFKLIGQGHATRTIAEESSLYGP